MAESIVLDGDEMFITLNGCMESPEQCPPKSHKSIGLTILTRSKATKLNADKDDLAKSTKVTKQNSTRKSRMPAKIDEHHCDKPDSTTKRRKSTNSTNMATKQPRPSYTSDESTRMPNQKPDDAQFDSLRTGPFFFPGRIRRNAQILNQKLGTELKTGRKLSEDETTDISLS